MKTSLDILTENETKLNELDVDLECDEQLTWIRFKKSKLSQLGTEGMFPGHLKSASSRVIES